MFLASDKAAHVLNLLEQLDMFYTLTNKRIARTKDVASMSEAQLLLAVRSKWFKKPNFINYFIGCNRATLSPQDIALLETWNNRIDSEFVYLEDRSDCSILYCANDAMLYAVHGLGQSLSSFMEKPIPAIIHARLLPYEESIIADGLIENLTPKHPQLFQERCQELLEQAHKAIASGHLITKLGTHKEYVTRKTGIHVARYIESLKLSENDAHHDDTQSTTDHQKD